MCTPRMLGRVSLRALLAVGPLAIGCGFFEELEDADTADTEASTDSQDGEGTGDGDTRPQATDGEDAIDVPCTIEDDDRCENQDMLASCDLATGVVSTVPCDLLCGDNINFSCISSATGVHACWCVVPGPQKVWSCSELEACLGNCSEPGACTDQCFGRTDKSTARMYGALVHCAEIGCSSTCQDVPEACGPCIANAIANGDGCTIPRALCDDDRSDDGWGYP